MNSFDTFVSREGLSTLKDSLTPPVLKELGLPCYRGAEFDFPTAAVFTKGVIKGLENGLLGFTLQDDIYNERVVWWMKQVRQSVILPEWIVPTHGVIFGLATAMRCFIKEGQRLLTFTPGYSRYEQAARRQGIQTITLPLADHSGRYSLDLTALDMTLKQGGIGLIVLSNPQNPTGMILKKEELFKLDQLSRQYEIPVYVDEIFAEITFADPVPCAVSLRPDDSYMISATSLGKCFSLTGINHANLLIPNPVLREKYIYQKYADHYGSIDPMLRMGLVSSYTEEGKAFVNELNTYVFQNLTILSNALKRLIPGTVAPIPEGTFCLYADYSQTGLSIKEIRSFLEKEALLFGDNGEEFGQDLYHERYAVAVPREGLLRSVSKLEEASLKRGWVR